MERQSRKEATHTGRCKTSWQDLATERIRPVWLKSFMVTFKHMKKNIQVVKSANSSGSVKKLK